MACIYASLNHFADGVLGESSQSLRLENILCFEHCFLSEILGLFSLRGTLTLTLTLHTLTLTLTLTLTHRQRTSRLSGNLKNFRN